MPVLVHFIRAGAIAMLEWASLRFIDTAPLYVWGATAVIALLVLAVIESRDFLNFKGSWYFPSFLTVLLSAWVIILGFAYATFQIHSGELSPEASIHSSPAKPVPRSKTTITDLLNESGELLDVVEKIGAPLVGEWQSSIVAINPQRICLNLDPSALKDKITNLSNKLIAAQNDINKIIEANRVDRVELTPLLYNGPDTAPFIAAVSNLEEYKTAIAAFNGKPSCEAVIESNMATNTIVQMNKGFERFSNWAAETPERIRTYQDKLRQELRNVP
jgi:hypothetical protein